MMSAKKRSMLSKIKMTNQEEVDIVRGQWKKIKETGEVFIEEKEADRVNVKLEKTYLRKRKSNVVLLPVKNDANIWAQVQNDFKLPSL